MPKGSTPVICFVTAALLFAIVWKVNFPERLAWLRVWLAICGFIIGGWGVITAANVIAYYTSARIRDFAEATTLRMRLASNAIKGLNSYQTEAVLSLERTTIEMIVDEDLDPIFVVRTLSGVVPFDFVAEYLEMSIKTAPYLWPERETSNWRWAKAITDLIISKGWADHGKGDLPAFLHKDRNIYFVAKRFGVELEQPEKEEANV